MKRIISFLSQRLGPVIDRAWERFGAFCTARVPGSLFLVFFGGTSLGDVFATLLLGKEHGLRLHFAMLLGGAFTYGVARLRARLDGISMKPPGAVEAHFSKTFDLMVETFGHGAEISCVTTAAGRIMQVACRHCQQKNRLREGIEGAACGKCKKSLVKGKDEKAEPAAASGLFN